MFWQHGQERVIILVRGGGVGGKKAGGPRKLKEQEGVLKCLQGFGGGDENLKGYEITGSQSGVGGLWSPKGPKILSGSLKPEAFLDLETEHC